MSFTGYSLLWRFAWKENWWRFPLRFLIFFEEDLNMNIIKVEVYGGINTGGGGCSCTTCTPADAKAEYEEMKKVLLNKYGEEKLSLEFIDTGGVKLAAYPEVEKVIRAGYSFPITVVNGSSRLAGAISVDSITEIITEIQNQK